MTDSNLNQLRTILMVVDQTLEKKIMKQTGESETECRDLEKANRSSIKKT